MDTLETLEELEKHRAGCTTCTPWSCCQVAARLLEQIGESGARALAPMPKPAGKA